jgi:hypothetical protein
MLCRPLSKNKAFRMTRIIQAAKVYNPEGGLAKTATEGALDAEQAVQNQLRQGSVNKGFAAGMEHLT